MTDEYQDGFKSGYHQAFIECIAIMQRYVDEKWIGHPADIIRGSEKLTVEAKCTPSKS